MPFTHNGQEYSDEQLAEVLDKHPELEKSYKKLEAEFTKTSQSKSELEKQSAQWKQFADEWGAFAQTVTNNPQLANELGKVYQNFQQGTLTKQDANTLQTALTAAKKDGDDDAVKELRDQLAEVRSALAEQEIDKTLDSLEKRAKSDGLDDFTLDGFQTFAAKWLEDEEGIGDDDNVTSAHLKRAYTAYEAHLLREQIKRGKVPDLGSNSTGAPPAKPKGDNKPRGLKARIAEATEFLSRS